MAESRSALIVGAGIGGLAAGVALKRAGWSVRIHERAESPRELGFGLVLAPNAIAALNELGIADAIAKTGVRTAGVEIRRINGELIRRFDARNGGPWIVALRPALHGALLDAVGVDAVVLSSEAVSFDQASDRVGLRLKDGSLDQGDVLIGADGVESVVRRALHPEERPARPSGFATIRGVAFGVGDQLGPLSAVAYLDDGLEAATVRASSDAVYWYLSLIASDLPANADTAEAVLATLGPRFEKPLRAIVAATRREDMRFEQLLVRDPLPTWGNGRVTLLGDAAHPVLPHTGQGAAQALEDAVALGLVLQRGSAIEPALRAYENVRSSRTRSFVKMGPRIARVTTTHSALITALRSGTIRLIPERLIVLLAARHPRDPHRRLRALSESLTAS